MITLKKYINKFINENYKININNELELHFYTEFILNESFKYSYFNILEKYGSYIGQKELIIDLSKEIYNIIRNHEPVNNIKLDKDDIKGYDNIFFNTLEIQLTNNKTGYQANKSNYIKNENKFDLVYIEISVNDYLEYKDLARCIMHEILHAWNHYQSFVKESEFNLQDLTNKNSKYYKTLFDGTISTKNICKRIINNLRQLEQNAYINELTIELDINKFDISKYSNINDAYKEAYNIFKNSDVWVQYSSEWSYIQNLNQLEVNSKERLDFQSTYNDINNTSMTFNQIYKKLDGLFNKILKKIEKVIPKIFYDYYENQMNKNIKESISGRQNMGLIKFIKYINEYDLMESVKPKNGKDWEVYVNGSLDKTFTKGAKKWKKYPKIGNGWYAGGTIFKIIKIEDNKVFTIEDK